MKAHIREEYLTLDEAFDIAVNMSQSVEAFTSIYDIAVLFHILKEKFYLTDELLGELFKEFRKLQNEDFLMNYEDKTETDELEYLVNYIKDSFKIDLEKDGFIEEDNDEDISESKCVTCDISNDVIFV